MAEYIEKEKIIEKIRNTPFGLNCTGETEDYKEGVLRGLVAKQHNVIDMINEQPFADVTPVAHGRWVEKPFLIGTSKFCSVCGENYGMPHGVYRYCPNCGAEMDGAENE